MLRVGLPDRYVTHGKPALLREEVGLTGESVAERVLAALRSASRSELSASLVQNWGLHQCAQSASLPASLLGLLEGGETSLCMWVRT